jgi:hypothetical protein
MRLLEWNDYTQSLMTIRLNYHLNKKVSFKHCLKPKNLIQGLFNAKKSCFSIVKHQIFLFNYHLLLKNV